MKPRSTVVAIVDDDPGVLESLGDLLKSVGYSVLHFSSGQALLAGANLTETDCIVTDIGMPLVDGYELQRLATQERPGLPVIFITGNADWMAAAQADGFSRGPHFHKPFDTQALVVCIAEAVGHRS